MHKTFFSSMALGAILILAGAGCLQNNQANNQEDSSAFTGSLAEAIELGQALECTWSSDDGSGTTYLKDGNMYAVTTYNGLTGHVVTDGQCSYIWEEGKTEGIEFCTDESFSEDLVDAENDIETYADAGVDYDVDVDCQRTNISDAQFNPPSDVTFINPFEMFSL